MRYLSERFTKQVNSYAGPRSTSLVAAALILGFLSFGTSTNEVSANKTEFIAWSGIAYQSLVISFAYFAIFSFLINRFFKVPSFSKMVAIGLLFFTTEMLRAIFVGQMGFHLGLTSDVNWGYRILAGGCTGLAMFGITAIVLNDNLQYKQNLNEFESAKNDLSKTLSVTEEDIVSIRTQILDTIRSAINESLNLVLKKPIADKANSKIVVDQLVRVSEEVVRPLSHQLFSNSFSDLNTLEKTKIEKVNTRKVLQLATYVSPFQTMPIFSLGFLLLIGGSLFGANDPMLGFFALALILGAFYLILSLATKFIRPQLHKWPVLIRVVVISSVYLFICMSLFQIRFISTVFSIARTTNSAIYFAVLALVLCWLLAIYPAIRVARAETLSNLDDINGQLSWANARLGAQLSKEKQHLAAVVHRDVQGKLIATALKFQQDVNAGKDQAEAVNELNSLVETITNLVVEPQYASSPSEVVNMLNEVWSGIFKLNLHLNPEAASRIERDSICRQTISDLISEFATNSVKHGKATNGEISIKLSSNSIVEIQLRNNGLPFPEVLQPGLGSQMASEQTLKMSACNLPGGGVQFEITLPIA